MMMMASHETLALAISFFIKIDRIGVMRIRASNVTLCSQLPQKFLLSYKP
jgi:hypothetical protein